VKHEIVLQQNSFNQNDDVKNPQNMALALSLSGTPRYSNALMTFSYVANTISQRQLRTHATLQEHG
jgi:hypothetical protein